ncbi:RHS repeat-associated core domain-containing protein [Luteibacter sp. PPL201]|uniref:RHS repeat-associated core domain-containing protein n=1 Tax=Luteibacter sahnii TaxID=3021977 RepID=A0ABT6BFJ9_9GAMM
MALILIWQMSLTAQAADKKVIYYYTDPQGTILATGDESGNVTSRSDYDPYGLQIQGEPLPGPGYTGHVSDTDSGLIYMQARYYDPALGRFLTPDSDKARSGQLLNFNRYAYASNNPVANIDPDGRQSVPGYYISGTNFRDPVARDFAFNAFVPGYAIYGCVSSGCNGSDWTIAVASTFLSVTPVGEAAALSRTARAVKTIEHAGNEAHNVVNGLKLSKALASEAQMSEKGTVIAGGASSSPFRNASRAAENYGGKSSDWVKKSSSSYTANDGTRFETHWLENTANGDRQEFKTILEKSDESNL